MFEKIREIKVIEKKQVISYREQEVTRYRTSDGTLFAVRELAELYEEDQIAIKMASIKLKNLGKYYTPSKLTGDWDSITPRFTPVWILVTSEDEYKEACKAAEVALDWKPHATDNIGYIEYPCLINFEADDSSDRTFYNLNVMLIKDIQDVLNEVKASGRI